MASPAHPPPVICFGQFELDAANGELRKAGISLKMHPQPLQVLQLLAGRPKQIVTRDEIRSALWGNNTFVDFERGINSCVNQIRTTLGDDPEKPRYVETLPRRGYRFIAAVTNGASQQRANVIPLAVPPECDNGSRYQSAAEMRTDMQRLKRDTESGRSAALPTLPATKSKTLRFWIVSGISAVVLLVLAIAAYFFVSTKWTRHQPARELVQRELTANPPENPIVSAVISPDGKSLAYSDRMGAFRLIQIDTSETRSLPSNLAGFVPISWFPDGNHLLVARAGVSSGLWKMSVWDATVRKLFDEMNGAVVSPDGRHIAFLKDNREIWLIGPDGEEPHRVHASDPKDTIWSFDWSPTGQRIVYLRQSASSEGQENVIETCNLDGSQHIATLSEPRLRGREGFSDLSWLPDGRIVYALTELPPNDQDSNLWTIDADPNTGRLRGKPSRLTNWTGYWLDNFSHSADGHRFLFSKLRYRDVVKVAEIGTKDGKLGAPLRFTRDAFGTYWAAAWTRDSRSIIFDSNRNGKWAIFKQNLHEPDVQNMVSGSENYTRPVLSPDGSWLLYSASASADFLNISSRRLMRMPVEGGPQVTLLSGPYHYHCAAVPSSVCVLGEYRENQLIFSSLDPAKGRGPELAKLDGSAESDWDLSADGKNIAVVQPQETEHQFRILSLATGAVRELDLKNWQTIQSVAWSADGNRIYVTAWSAHSSNAILSVDLQSNVRVLLEVPAGQSWLSSLVPSPNGRYLAFTQRIFERNATVLENF